MEECSFFMFHIFFFISVVKLCCFLCLHKNNKNLVFSQVFLKCAIIVCCLNLQILISPTYVVTKTSKSKCRLFLKTVNQWKGLKKWKNGKGQTKQTYQTYQTNQTNQTDKRKINAYPLKAETKNDMFLSFLKNKCNKEKKKNVIYIENGDDDKNKVNYINDTLNNEVKQIKYLTNLQKNFIYLIERNRNLVLHAKTSSGKTTICLYYFILKFVHKCEFIFQEDLERKKYFVDDIHFENWKKEILNQKKKWGGINTCLGTPFSKKYTELSDLTEVKNLMLEEKIKLKLKEDEKILILCPSKELCVQICHIILSLVGTKNERIVKLIIDKESEINTQTKDKGNNTTSKKEKLKDEETVGETEKKEGVKNRTSDINMNINKIERENSISSNFQNAKFLLGTSLCFKQFILQMKKEELNCFLKKIKYIFYDELDKLFPTIRKHSSLQKRKNLKKKNAHIILESIMCLNVKKDTTFVGCSSTLNRIIHRSIFRLLCLNTYNRKKEMFLLREKREGQKGEAPKKSETDTDEESEKELDKKSSRNDSDNYIKNIGYNGTNFEPNFKPNFEPDFETDFETDVGRKHIVKVMMPSGITHFYYVVKNDSTENKINNLYRIITNVLNKRILILIKNGCSQMTVKNVLESKSVHCLFLHEELEISLFENNKNRKKLSENYKKIKNLKPIKTEIKKKGYINKFPIIISSFDSVRGFHINNLDVVLLFNKPQNVNEYIHLSGRVGRRNRTGCSITLENEKNINIVKKWLNILGTTINEFVLSEDHTKQEQREEGKEEIQKQKENIQKETLQESQINETHDFDFVKQALMDELTEDI